MNVFWISLILCGCLCISLMQVVKRFALKDGSMKPTTFLACQMFVTATSYGVLYLATWGWELPELAPRFWQAVALCALANLVIQYLNTKVATMQHGEVSLTAPLQAMTPGMITLLAIILHEFPGLLGLCGILCMAGGSYYIMWPKQKEAWYDWIGPVYRLRQLLHLNKLDPAERDRTLAVSMAIASAACGTFGLLFESLYVRRAYGMQGLVLGSMALSGILSLTYGAIYLAGRLRHTPTNKDAAASLRPRHITGIVVIGLLFAGHQLLIQPAFAHLLTSYVGTLKRLSIIMSTALGIWLFKEGKNELKNRWWAAILITLGSILISWDGIMSKMSNTFETFGL